MRRLTENEIRFIKETGVTPTVIQCYEWDRSKCSNYGDAKELAYSKYGVDLQKLFNDLDSYDKYHSPDVSFLERTFMSQFSKYTGNVCIRNMLRAFACSDGYLQFHEADFNSSYQLENKLETAKERCIEGIERIVSDYVEREDRRNKTVDYSSLEIDVIDTRLTKVENQIDIMSIMQSLKSIMKRILTDDEYLVISFEYGLDEIDEVEKDRLLQLLDEGLIEQLLESAMLKIRLEINKSNISSFFKSFF